MNRVNRLQGWVEAQVARVRPALTPMVERLREIAATTEPRLRQAVAETRARIKPMAEAAEPQGRKVASALGRGASTVGPAVVKGVDAVRYQVEAGRDARAMPRVLRDAKGRRLRASAYAYGPDTQRRGRRPYRGAPEVAGSFFPAAAKIAAVVLIAILGFLGSASAYINYAAELPDAHIITSQPLAEDTQIYAADGTLLADLHQPDAPQHYYESLDQMGKWLPLATVAVEDSGFWDEPGIDVFAMGRAAWVDYRSHQAVQGASTITQQLVKLRLTSNAPTIERKIKEAVLALQVEHMYTKRQILEQYLNAVDYANNAKGTLAASRVYFHKDTKALDLAQASMLAGIPQSPFWNNPFVHWEQARKRQHAVLDAMVRTRKVTQEQADEAYAEDISPPDHMFRPNPQVLAAPGFVSWIKELLSDKYGAQAVYAGGLQVHTTVNMQIQRLAEQAVVEGVSNARQYNASQGAMVAIDPRTGAVVAMVGSANYEQNQYNMAVDRPRNPGSSFKIYNYTAAIETGKFTMSTKIPDTPLSIRLPPGSKPNPYAPVNYDGKYHGTCQLQQCMGNSLNVPAVKVEITIGVDKVVDMARRMGAPPFNVNFQPDGTAYYTQDDPPSAFGPTLTLGGYGETPLQMATGASVLGAQGVYHQPFGITSVRTSDGTEIFNADPSKTAKQVVDPKVAFIMEQIMSNNANRTMIFGPNSPLTFSDRTIAAKTGTTDDFRDAWTVGYTPSLASAFWFGNIDNTPMTKGADGVFVAAPAWHQFMGTALDAMNASKREWFSEPPGLGHATVDGLPVWLLPGTRADQPRPPLPSNASESAPKDCGNPGGGPTPSPSPSPSPSNNANCPNGKPPGG
jgi:membrane peptidoglycan carboxypeptidase